MIRVVHRGVFSLGSVGLAALLVVAACSPDGGRLRRGDGGGDGSAGDRDGSVGPGHDAGPHGRFACPGYEVRPGDCEDPATIAILQARDSDRDGLNDYEEVCVYGSDPCRVDSNGDGVSDRIRVAAGLDPAGMEPFPADDFAVILPYLGDRADRLLRFGTDINQADVFFLVDMTGSMRGERTNLIRGLLEVIIPGVEAAIPDVQFGAGGFDDYPYSGYGGGRDLPFYLLREIAPTDQDLGAWSIPATDTTCPSNPATNDIGTINPPPNGREDILEAVEGLPCHGGADGPESFVPALYATATGMGLTWPTGSIPSRTCPAVPDEVGTRRGYPCFRAGSLPIILLFGDAPFHNGPSGNTYSFPAPSYTETVAALNAIGARVLGIHSGGSYGFSDFEAMARDTGTVRADGSPLVFSINADGTGLDAAVVEAVRDLVGGTPQDVSTRTENVPGNPDEFDATLFIKSITPVEGYREGVAGTGYTSFDATTFYGVIPGTLVEFEIDFWNDVRPGQEQAQVFRARIYVVGNGVADLDRREVYIVVPGEDEIILF